MAHLRPLYGASGFPEQSWSCPEDVSAHPPQWTTLWEVILTVEFREEVEGAVGSKVCAPGVSVRHGTRACCARALCCLVNTACGEEYQRGSAAGGAVAA